MTRSKGFVAAAIVIVAVAAFGVWWWIVGPGPMAFAGGSTVTLADYHTADPTGVPAELANADRIKRGEYLARAADCEVCHTAPGIGNCSDADFLNAVQRGIRRDGARLYPAMPYPSYTYMTNADALAIKAYLFSQPAVPAANRADTLGFPFN